MDKPSAQTVVSEQFDYHEMIEYIEEKYKIDVRDYAGKFKGKHDYEHWLKSKNYKTAKDVPEQQEQYVEFVKDVVEGRWKEPEYLDFWHYMLETWFNDVHNGCEQYVNWSEVREYAEQKGTTWVVEIASKLEEEFPGDLTVWIEW